MQSLTTTNALLMAGSVALLAAASHAFVTIGQGKELHGAPDVMEEEDTITEELVVKIFDRLFVEMQMVLQQLSHQIQTLQKAGQIIPEQQLRQLLTAEYERALISKQNKVFEDFDVDADCIEEATWEFLKREDEYPKAKRAVDRFQQLYESVSGQSVVGRRPGVTLETKDAKILTATETIEAATVYFGALSGAMRELAEKFKSEGKNLKEPTVQQELQMKFASLANEVGETALEEAKGITTKDFQASIEKNATDPKVGRQLQMLQMQQQQEMVSLLG